MSEIIWLGNVIKMYPDGRRAINDLSLSIHEKESVMVSGAPGSGKSTLMRLIAGMEKPSAGKIFVLEKSVHDMNADIASEFRNKHVGVMQRNPFFMARLTVLENVTLPLIVQGMTLSVSTKVAKERLKSLGILYIANTYPSQLSIYEAQIASLARALITQPKILLLDEITANLTLKEADQITGIINAIGQSGDFTVVSFSAANSSGLYSDRFVRLDHGTIQEDMS